MILDSNMFDFQGTQCDRIGVSFEAFYSQSERCRKMAGSCLKGQIDDYRQSDLNKIASGLVADYIIKFSMYGNLSMYRMTSTQKMIPLSKVDTKQVSSKPYLGQIVKQKQATLITLEFVADDIQFITNVANGKIMSINSSNFESNSKNGKMVVIIWSSGEVPSQFYVGVMDCSLGVVSVAEQQATINPKSIYQFEFDIRVENTKTQMNQCNVTLKNSIFQVIDSKITTFTSTDTIKSQGAQSGTASPIQGDVIKVPRVPSSPSCSDCPVYNPLCFLKSLCIKELFAQFASLFTIVILIIVIAFLVKTGRCLNCTKIITILFTCHKNNPSHPDTRNADINIHVDSPLRSPTISPRARLYSVDSPSK
eukprot:NODE_902_length_2259_cov_40.073034_g769_i0.p1 GENE.NODE_902_length_2259_cov_40.073034_g769_i0~~NODE_902_length_2259_cov_40.073034_g769_i0.p1  ORF type:complete len:365 (+),score=50.32 NODE_902_length_2259_cov_40.073034_g769_i0:1025-2119(+)